MVQNSAILLFLTLFGLFLVPLRFLYTQYTGMYFNCFCYFGRHKGSAGAWKGPRVEHFGLFCHFRAVWGPHLGHHVFKVHKCFLKVLVMACISYVFDSYDICRSFKRAWNWWNWEFFSVCPLFLAAAALRVLRVSYALQFLGSLIIFIALSMT